MASDRGGSLLLRGGRVIDGSGAPARIADVAVRDGMVTAVGPALDVPSGAVVVEVSDLVVAPGFIDLHTHCDFTLPRYPRADAMVRQGVTTIVTGNCGSTPYPIDPDRAGLLRDSTAHLGTSLRWNWRDAAGYADILDAEPLALNVVLLVGHTSIRIAAMGFERRPPTERELMNMRGLVTDAMEQGCAGLSSGLIYSPGSYAERAELVALASVAAEHGGFYATHMRNEGPALLTAVEEALAIASSSGAGLQLSHHKVLGRSNWGLTERSLARIGEAQAAGMDVLLDQYPYDATSTTLTALLPTWMLEGGIASMQARLHNDETRAAARAEMLNGPTDGRPKRDFEPDTVTIASIHGGRRNDFEGRTIADLAQAERREPVDCFLDLLADEGGGIEVVIAAIGEDDIRRVMRNPTVAVASDGWTLSPDAGGTPHPRSYGTFARVLGHYSRDEAVIPIEEAVRKMTSLPAQRLGMTNRGLVRPGARADLVVFDPTTVIDRATYEQPHQFCGGVYAVFVDGTAVVRDGVDTGAVAGAVLRRRRNGYAQRQR
ncbi:MAG TPA: D-aminoacylase [Candidatus Saccharimonadales bacterium]|nr:D-aminoacylase [Candidatus Saccharimonadales bacterium]